MTVLHKSLLLLLRVLIVPRVLYWRGAVCFAVCLQCLVCVLAVRSVQCLMCAIAVCDMWRVQVPFFACALKRVVRVYYMGARAGCSCGAGACSAWRMRCMACVPCAMCGVRLQHVVCLFHMARARNKCILLAMCEVRCVGHSRLQMAGAGR